MPESLWKNWPKPVLAYSWFLVVALLLVLSVASPDVALLCRGQITNPCSSPTCGCALMPVNRRALCEKGILVWESCR